MQPLKNREQVAGEIMNLLKTLREDWEYSGELSEKTGIFRDLGFESIDAVALGEALEECFARPFPFVEFLTRAKEADVSDITIGSLIDFIIAAMNEPEGSASR